MKTKRGAVTCPRSHSKSIADFQQTGSGLDSFLNHALQGEAGKEGNQEEWGCTSVLQKVVSYSVARKSNSPRPAHRKMNNRDPVQEPRPWQEPGEASLKERRFEILPCSILVLPFPVPLPTFTCLFLCFLLVVSLAPGLSPSRWLHESSAQAMPLTCMRTFCDSHGVNRNFSARPPWSLMICWTFWLPSASFNPSNIFNPALSPVDSVLGDVKILSLL